MPQTSRPARRRKLSTNKQTCCGGVRRFLSATTNLRVNGPGPLGKGVVKPDHSLKQNVFVDNPLLVVEIMFQEARTSTSMIIGGRILLVFYFCLKR